MVTTDDAMVEGVDLDGMRSALDQSAVVFAVLFGSHASGTAEQHSDVDVALRFADDLDERERFQVRNRIDADLQQYADAFVDVSDIEHLPTTVAYAAVRDGVVLVGDEETVETYRARIEQEYESTRDEREQDRREFIDRLASGDA